ncbi:cobalt-precorrin-6Y C(5)-methyltransferase (cobalt-precorrin-6 methyltransferase) [Paenibacillus sp. FSL R7-277]|uniref:bifunctional cobalt-precorrin-7 (C(5))-methyltransferase/cobalt-precorrin-6B (C(15))-methyltransferase n=1 Tax=Paenibacillus sp. FSL R7-277 TaxID=1227352 RepID=UPI0003E21DE5|nr:bifunctional cobalt-precorrin-7 (C(5))-methyltransferase/cobalt-precorrin-6B (C(15))-methyltransferase [Paenibacillus sp. FSL R7-277]ETT77515.1 cobalt-precorrin-6Y C(5)-methyltransferase (cobalt-precorrin-6 methyltransferase) [Paenibacillus sp. FSL R7-277]
MDNLIYVIGIGEDGAGGLTPDSLSIVNNSEVLLGGERQLNFFGRYRGEKIVLQGGLKPFTDKLEEVWRERRTVVLASGDPFFFGIAGYLVRRFGPEHVEVIPHYSSVQLAFARLGDSWQDAELISLHGRPIQGLAQRIDGRHKIALLTDENNTPAVIAAYLQEFGMVEYEAFVCERLGGAEEICRFWTLEEMETREFAALNVVILRRKQEVSAPVRRGFAYPDGEFRQRKPEKGLITKREVRALVLSELNLSEDAVVWDIGSGSGAVAAECARIARLGRVYALEKSAENLPNMAENRLKFRADFEIIQAKAPQGLAALPDPDAVFIGGSGGELAAIIEHSAARLQPGGRIVVGAITVETLHGSMEAFKAAGLACEVTMLQASRGKPILGMTRFDGMNPVYVVSGRRLH